MGASVLYFQMKLKRLLRYMKFKDMKAAITRNASVDEDEIAEHGKVFSCFLLLRSSGLC